METVDEVGLLQAQLTAERAKVKEYDTALQSLTPGGSEYVSDPKACVDFVRNDRIARHELIKKQKLELDAERAKVAALVEALKMVKQEAALISKGPGAGNYILISETMADVDAAIAKAGAS